MIEYSKHYPRNYPDHFILNVGTNNLKSEITSQCVAESVIDLAVSLKNDKREVSISNIVVRTYN